MATRIAGIQPGYLPWLGYFDQMLQVDAFLIADELPYSSSGWTRRNRIKGPDGPVWLTLPVRAEANTPICDAKLDEGAPWLRRHTTSLRHLYARGRDVDSLVDGLAAAVPADAERMVDASIPGIRFMAERLGVKTPILVSSELGLEAKYRERFPEEPGPTHRIAAYLEVLGAQELLEGAAGRDYFDIPVFTSLGCRVVFHDYVHPEYEQLHGAFVSHLSAMDLLLSVGEGAAQAVLRGACGGVQ